MDFQNRVGGKTGTGGLLSASAANAERRERLRRLMAEAADVFRDPYVARTPLGMLECKLCATLHKNEGSYVGHTQSRKHIANVARRAAKDAGSAGTAPGAGTETPKGEKDAQTRRRKKRRFRPIGRPEVRVDVLRDAGSGARGVLVQVRAPACVQRGVTPQHRVLSPYETSNPAAQGDTDGLLLVVAAEPYESVAVRLPGDPALDADSPLSYSHWDPLSGVYAVQLMYATE